MVISLKKFKMPMLGLLILVIIFISLFMVLENKKDRIVMGGSLVTNDKHEKNEAQSVFNSETDNISERFQRPSKQSAYKLKYAANDFITHSDQSSHIQTIFKTPEDVIQAYYAILKDASNMEGFHGGCGTVGWSKIPYPFAYKLLSADTEQNMTLEKFIDSFAGIGHITLLKLYPAYQPPSTPIDLKYYMVEIEVITGPPYKGEGDNRPQPCYFAYYYGLITTVKTPSEGWKIKSIDYVPEDFLCHPLHHWDYDAKSLVGIVYMNWYGLIDGIEKIDREDSLIHVYADESNNKYRFDFVRLTNGDDILMHEYILQNGQWLEVNLLKKEDQFYKFSVLNPKFINHKG
ncbi:MAG: hypothetical protein Q8942_13700 [Bacillota bacterium]|nr:hypothetical protein [Bacillota bacterium]